MDWNALADAIIKVGREFGLYVIGGGALVWLISLYLKRTPKA